MEQTLAQLIQELLSRVAVLEKEVAELKMAAPKDSGRLGA